MSRWFRFYDAALDDPKVQRLPGDLFKTWVNLLCAASRNDGRLPELADLAFMLRLPEDVAAAHLESLMDAGLLDDLDGEKSPHNWDARQFKSDVSTDRVKRFRKRSEKRDETVSETPSETEQIQNRAERESPRAHTRFAPSDWTPDPAIERMCRVQPGVDRDYELGQFRLHEFVNGKQDWNRAWAKWLNAARPRNIRDGPGQPVTRETSKHPALVAERMSRSL